MKSVRTSVLILGGGPGGYVAAIRAAQLGLPTVLIESQALGGTCLNVGCIPSKALIHVAERFHELTSLRQDDSLGISVGPAQLDIARSVQWKDRIVDRLTSGVGALLSKHKVQVIHGQGHIVDGKTVEVASADLRIECEHLVLATGSETVGLPGLPWAASVISSTEALAPATLPQRLCVVGAGYIGLELGIAYRKLGCEVDIVEAQSRILPSYDRELTAPIMQRLQRMGIGVHLGTRVESFDEQRQCLKLTDAAGSPHELPADRVLVAIGRRPRTAGYNLESLGLSMSGRCIEVDSQCRTSMRNVWAIGDLTGEPMLAHRAMAQGELVAEVIAGKHREFCPAAIAAVCFTDPELVVVGLSPEQVQDQPCKVASFPFAANGRAMTLESSDGFVRVVARADNHLILGWQAVGKGVSELAAGFALSLEMGATLEDIAGTVHAHPTLGEAIQEVAMRALGRALHV